jgi:hypothetical protein
MTETDQPATQRLRLHILRLRPQFWESRLLVAYSPVHLSIKQWRPYRDSNASHLAAESINYRVCTNLLKQLLVVSRAVPEELTQGSQYGERDQWPG